MSNKSHKTGYSICSDLPWLL